MVWNELEGCRCDIPNLPKHCFDEIFALDGGSTDGTVNYLVEQGIPVMRQPEPGYNRAYIAAFERTSCDALVIFHPKGSIDPRSLEQMIAPFRAGTQMVIASRNAKGGRNEEDSKLLKPRKWFVLALSGLGALLWWRGGGPIVWDVLHGYRGMRRDAFFGMDPLGEGLSMDLQMVVRSYRLGFTRSEVPVEERSRLTGTSHFKAFPTGMKLLKYIWFELQRGRPVQAGKRSAVSGGESS